MNKLTFTGLALSLLIGLSGINFGGASATAGQGQGQPGQRPQGPPPQGAPREPKAQDGEAMLFALLDLTNEQKEQIKKLHDAEKNAAKPIHEQMKTTHEQLRAATKDGAFNEAVVRSLLAQTQQPELELEVLHIKTRAAIFNVLTPAQKIRLAELRATMERNHAGPPPPRD